MAIYSDPSKKKLYPGMSEEERNAQAARVPASVNVQSAAVPLGRKLFDNAAKSNDMLSTPATAVADYANRGAMALRNIGRTGLGKEPLEPAQFSYTRAQDKLAEIRAGNAPKPAGVSALPTPRPAAPSPSSTTARKAPSQTMTGDQASRAEVAARNQASSPGPSSAVGAAGAAGAGAASLRRGDPNTFTGINGVTRAVPMPQAGSVNTQSFGVQPGVATLHNPVASTFGLSVNDPRINDQVASVARPQGTFRGPDAMAEQYNSREDREARNKLLSDLDSQRFRLEMIAGNPGRRGRAALEALGQNAQQQAALIAGGEKLSADAVQGRANRNNVLANTGMEQAGQTTRQRMAGDVASQGQLLDYDARNRATEASLIDKPQYVTDAQGRYLRVGSDGAAPVTDAAGSVIQMPPPAQQRDYKQEADNDLFAQLMASKADQMGNPLPNAVDLAMADMQKYRAAQQPRQANQTKPDFATFLARAKAQGSKMTEEQLKAAYANL